MWWNLILVSFACCAIAGCIIGGVLRQNPVAGFMLGLAFGPLGLLLAYFLEGDDEEVDTRVLNNLPR